MKSYFLTPLILQKAIWIPTRALFMICGRLEVRGLEHLRDLKTNAVFACNHTSELDVFVVPASLPIWSRFLPMFYISRERAFYQRAGARQRFYGGRLFRAGGGYPATPGLKDYDQALKEHLRILRDGGNVCIFPEGRITPDGSVGQGKGGVAHLSYATKRPIVPVYIQGLYKFKLFQKITVTFGAPIYEAAQAARIPSYDEFKNMAQNVMNRIRALSVANEVIVTDSAEEALPEAA